VTTVPAITTYDPYSWELDEDPYPTYRWLRDHDPVHRNDELDFWALTRFDDVFGAFLDVGTFSSRYGTSLEFMTAPRDDAGMMLWMDPPKHNRYRTLVSKIFTPRQVSALEPEVRAIAVEHLSALAGRDTFDVVAEFTARLPMDVISAMLGIPASERRWVQERSNAILHRDPGNPLPSAEASAAGAEVHGWFGEQIAEVRAHPRDDLMTLLTQVETIDEETGEPARLSDNDVQVFLMLLATAGNETVTKLLATIFFELWRHPDQRAAVVADPDLAPRVVEETLRWDPPSQYQGRVVTRDVELHGTTIPAGGRALLVNGACGRDERTYPDPDRFDLHRTFDLHLGFGHGRHVCLGASLARLESRIGVAELLARFPDYEIPDDGRTRMHSSNVRGLSRLVMQV